MLHLCCFLHDDGEDVCRHAVYGDRLLGAGLGHAAGEHGEEVVGVGRQHHAVPREHRPIHHQLHVAELTGLKTHFQMEYFVKCEVASYKHY